MGNNDASVLLFDTCKTASDSALNDFLARKTDGITDKTWGADVFWSPLEFAHTWHCASSLPCSQLEEATQRFAEPPIADIPTGTASGSTVARDWRTGGVPVVEGYLGVEGVPRSGARGT